MEIRDGSIQFEALSGNGPREASSEIHFPREVRNAIAGLPGYSVKFRDGPAEAATSPLQRPRDHLESIEKRCTGRKMLLATLDLKTR